MKLSGERSGAFVGLAVLVLSWFVLQWLVFDFGWHSFDYSIWILPVGLFSVECFVVGWFFIAPGVERRLISLVSGDTVTLVMRMSIATTIASFGFRLLVPKDSSWFGDLGDYFNPPLAFISLAILALALGLQREDLRSTRENLALAQRQLEEEAISRRIADSPWVLLKELRIGHADSSVEMICVGSAPALNVRISVNLLERENWPRASFPEHLGESLSADCAALFSGNSVTARLRKSGEDAIDAEASASEYLFAIVQWENVQGIRFRYGVTLTKGLTGIWRVADRLYPEGESFVVNATHIK